MKKNNVKIALLSLAMMIAYSCNDFEEINKDPLSASVDQVQVEYFINSSIGGAQQNPHIAERIFILYWKAAGHMDRIGTLPVGRYNDDWTKDYFDKFITKWLKDITTAINVSDEKIASGNIKPYTKNLKQVARIWRAYIISEMTDNFGPIATNVFSGENPEYSSVKDVYYFMLKELKEATSELDLAVNNPNELKKLDPAFEYDYTKWKKYGNSLRMRLAMRLSEVDESKAKEEFEDAVNGSVFIETSADNFKIQELEGWNDYTGVMSRPWNMQYLSPTSNNLMIGLGGVKTADMLPSSQHAKIKPLNYFGKKYDQHFTSLTNDPSASFWFDGLHNTIDPRAYKAYMIPGDFDNSEFNFYPPWSSNATRDMERELIIGEVDSDDNGETDDLKIDVSFTWNTTAIGSWGTKGQKNRLRYPSATPRLANKYRNSTSQRIFYGSWESYFLIAEAAVRGWSVPMSGKEAYEKGIAESFEYFGVSGHLSDYLTSEDYNRAGTSVSWNHTTEPPSSVTMNYVDGYTGTAGTFSFKYPENTIYKNGSVKNDYLNKIITQKFIAQTPWLPLEAWSDHRRLGLPFFENPAVEEPLTNLPDLNSSSVMTNNVKFFPQRLKYPSSFEANVPNGYQQAVNLLGGEDSVFTPLWWAKQN